MRWIPLIILAYATALVQATFSTLIGIDAGVGRIAPDLLAVLAVFVALWASNLVDALLAAWILGFAVDLISGGGPGVDPPIGPMPIGYVLAAWLTFSLREGLFREKPLPQAMLAIVFVLISHVVWLVLQAIRAGSAEGLATMLAQAGGVAVYTALVAPFIHPLLWRVRGLLIITAAPARGRR